MRARYGNETTREYAEACLVEIDRLEGEIARLQTEHARALAAVDGVDYREGYYRDNTTPDELRCIVLGLALKIERLDALLHRGLGKGM